MNRRKILKSAGGGLVAAVVTSPAIAQSAPSLRWRLTTSFPKNLDTLYGACEMFSKAMAELSDQKFQIQVFGPGEIVPALQVFDAVSNGTIEMGNSASYYYIGKDPAFAFGTAVPFGLNTRQMNAWLAYGGALDLLNELHKPYNIYCLPFGNTTAQMGGWFRKEVKTLDDLKGLKFRVGGLAGQVLSRLGVVPQQIPGSEIYTALEKGTIDAAEWVGPYDDERLGFQKIAPYYYYPGWWEGGAMLHNFINIDKWNSLTPAYKSILRTACAMGNDWMTAKYDYGNPVALKKMLQEGIIQFRQFPASVMEASLKAALEVYAEVSARNADFKKVWGSMLAFRNDAYLWWRVAEYTYDDFLIRNRTRT